MTTAHALTTKAMTVNLTLGLWQAQRLDKGASQEVTTRAGASADAARVNKHLINKEALAPVITAGGALRTHFYEHTMPWKDNGDRILTRKMYLKFVNEHEELAAKFRGAVDKFLDEDYPREIARAEFRMGELFRRDDYPEASKLRHKFYVSLGIDAITSSGDFRVELDEAELAKVRAEIDASAEARVKAAMSDVWNRLLATVGHIQSTLGTPDKVFRNSTLTNVIDLISMSEGLNLVDDPNLTAVCAELDQIFGSCDAKDLRNDATMRGAVATEAEAIVEKMRGFAALFDPQ